MGSVIGSSIIAGIPVTDADQILALHVALVLGHGLERVAITFSELCAHANVCCFSFPGLCY